MAQVELIMPKMGESIMEATILKWVKNVGDAVEVDETILEIATDKVDSEVPSPVSGVISKILFEENETVEIGKVIAMIATEGEEVTPDGGSDADTEKSEKASQNGSSEKGQPQPQVANAASSQSSSLDRTSSSGKFYSPLVRNIAEKENISLAELDQIEGSGLQGRVTKKDILAYIDNKGTATTTTSPKPAQKEQSAPAAKQQTTTFTPPAISTNGSTEIVEMDRMRKLIADHMVNSKRTSPHVTSFVEADVTNLFNWRSKNKKAFQERYGEKITFTPIFIEAIVKAIKDYPMINVSVNGDKIIVKKDINVGMAAALPSGNLIVPVIKNADFLNLAGLTKSVNDLANRARNNKLKPEEIQDGTFTLTNVGTFGNVMGTPIINQPQVAILAAGAIRKKPAVVETEYGDLIAVRQMMFLSLSYDHRVVDGFLGGSFLRRVADYLEQFDPNREL
ncbi:MAG: 2-oxo acid dehydrogenase subunit E2 [Saprospiraceae bacterium]|nr:2-oxo acid dehydrogenase subunit E2 [Saprospiraceae bacterium]